MSAVDDSALSSVVSVDLSDGVDSDVNKSSGVVDSDVFVDVVVDSVLNLFWFQNSSNYQLILYNISTTASIKAVVEKISFSTYTISPSAT